MPAEDRDKQARPYLAAGVDLKVVADQLGHCSIVLTADTYVSIALELALPAAEAGGRAVIVEWARERFDEATAGWCLARLPAPDDDPGWLHRRQAEWRQSGQRWDAFLRSWADAEGLHAGQDILDELDARFECQVVARGAYFFPDLAGTSDADEQAAIDSGLIQPNRIQYAGRRRSHPPQPPT